MRIRLNQQIRSYNDYANFRVQKYHSSGMYILFLTNNRLISNLSFLSKLTERIVLARLNGYHSSYSFLNPHQSDFIKHHSAETLLICLANLYLLSAIRKYPTYVSLTSLPHLIL